MILRLHAKSEIHRGHRGSSRGNSASSVGCALASICSTRLPLAPHFYHPQDPVLQIGHDCVGPQFRVPIEVGGDTMLAGKMQANGFVTESLEAILAMEHVEERATYAHVFVERCLGD